MKKKAVFTTAFISLLFLVASGAFFVDLAVTNAAFLLPAITINSDGSISPQTELISRNGNNYTLTADIQENPIVIKRSDIIFDGTGHTINVTEGDNCGLSLKEVNNVIVRNITVYSRHPNTIDLFNSNNCLITRVQAGIRVIGDFNNITKSTIGIIVSTGSNNLVTRNNINDVAVGPECYSNKFFQNNFYLNAYPEFFTESIWDNGSVGNYWSNYTMKYPNASEIGNTGIGDTPYVIQRGVFTTRDYPDVKNVDYYPLMCPYDIENDAIVFPTPEPTSTPEPGPFPTTLVAVTSETTAVVVGVSLLVYFKKRHIESGVKRE
jgi:hypothetical protein